MAKPATNGAPSPCLPWTTRFAYTAPRLIARLPCYMRLRWLDASSIFQFTRSSSCCCCCRRRSRHRCSSCCRRLLLGCAVCALDAVALLLGAESLGFFFSSLKPRRPIRGAFSPSFSFLVSITCVRSRNDLFRRPFVFLSRSLSLSGFLSFTQHDSRSPAPQPRLVCMAPHRTSLLYIHFCSELVIRS